MSITALSIKIRDFTNDQVKSLGLPKENIIDFPMFIEPDGSLFIGSVYLKGRFRVEELDKVRAILVEAQEMAHRGIAPITPILQGKGV